MIRRAIVIAALALAVPATSFASSVAIVQGGFYTTDLRDALLANGVTVTEIANYTAASLAGYDAVIHYGNSFFDGAELVAYANAGGTVIATPWFWSNFQPTDPELQIFNSPDIDVYNSPILGTNVLAPGDPLLNGVVFPAAGSVNAGWESANTFGAGVTQVAEFTDGTAFIGYLGVGAGRVIGINLHVITSDTAYTVINEQWATQLFLNAVDAQAVPEPATMALLGLGLLGVKRARARRR
jgi:hypothetical protein